MDGNYTSSYLPVLHLVVKANYFKEERKEEEAKMCEEQEKECVEKEEYEKNNGKGRREERIRGSRMERRKIIIKLNIIYINESLSCASILKSEYTWGKVILEKNKMIMKVKINK